MPDPLHLLLLFAAALVGGGLNSVAGGGSFFTFPALLLSGVAPIPANATSTVALWPGTVASAVGYREELRHDRRVLVAFGVAGVAGGVAGALLLLFTPSDVFERLVPFLLLAATGLFAFGGPFTRWLRRKETGHHHERGPDLAAMTFVMFVIAVYGGYFGGGMGFMLLAAFAVMGMTSVHHMNGLKTLLTAAVNGVAIVAFVVAGIIEWPIALLMVGGSVLGGYGGARLAKRVDPARVRVFVIGVGAVLTAYFFWRTYGPA